MILIAENITLNKKMTEAKGFGHFFIHTHDFSCRKYCEVPNIAEQARSLYMGSPIDTIGYLAFLFSAVKTS